MDKKKEKKEKIPLRRLISNIVYVLKYALRDDKKMVISYLVGYSMFVIGNMLFDTVLLKMIIDELGNETPLYQLILTIVIGLVVLVVQVVAINVTEQYMFTKLVKTTGNLQRQFFEKAANMDLICYDHPEYFDDFVIAASQCDGMIAEGVQCVAYVIGNTIGVITSAIFILTINPIIAIFPVLGFIINIITRFAITKLEYNYEIEKKKINRKSDYSKRVFYQPEYAKEIKLSGISDCLVKQFNKSIDEEKKMARSYGIKIAILSLINWIFVFTFLAYFCVPMYLGYLALVTMSIGLGDVASLNNAASAIRNNLDSTNYALVQLQKLGQYAEKFRRFVDYKENIETHVGTVKVPESGDIEIKNLSYKYDGAENYTLKNINMKIKNGEKIAIVGENGAGKTTFIKLLMRLYDVTDGEITFGGENIKNFTTSEYRAKIGAVFQDYQIYAATLAENVVMREYNDKDESNILKSLGNANFNDKLMKLDDGIKAEMTREFSEKGTMLSGGEAQKVAISRMFAKGKNLAVSILDEPSSALDPIAEYTLNTNMMANAENSTIVFISHRLSTTREADRIYMFEHGEIVEEGTHDELMAMNGEYAEMFEKQAHYYKLKSHISA